MENLKEENAGLKAKILEMEQEIKNLTELLNEKQKELATTKDNFDRVFNLWTHEKISCFFCSKWKECKDKEKPEEQKLLDINVCRENIKKWMGI